MNKVLLKSQSLLEKLQAYVKEGTVILDDKQKIVTEEENRLKKEREEAERKKREKEEAEKKKKAEEQAREAKKKAEEEAR